MSDKLKQIFFINRRMMALAIAAVIIFGVFFILYMNNPKTKNQVCIKEKCFSVEIAETPYKRTIGLMFRKELDKDSGMLFVFDKEGIYSFWMKNTFIPLDIIWIDKDGKAVFISENTQPCKMFDCSSIKPSENAKYVLEINAGLVKEIGLNIGDRVVLPF